MNRLKLLLITFLSVINIGVLAAVPVAVHAATGSDIPGQVQCGADLQIQTGSTCTSDSAGSQQKVNDIVKLVINIFSLVVGFVAVIMIIVGGFKYITSGGESSNTASAKNTILFAIVGLVVVAVSQFIVRYVLARTANTVGQ